MPVVMLYVEAAINPPTVAFDDFMTCINTLESFSLWRNKTGHTPSLFLQMYCRNWYFMCMDKYFFCKVLNETHYYVDRDLLGCDAPTFMINMLPLEYDGSISCQNINTSPQHTVLSHPRRL